MDESSYRSDRDRAVGDHGPYRCPYTSDGMHLPGAWVLAGRITDHSIIAAHVVCDHCGASCQIIIRGLDEELGWPDVSRRLADALLTRAEATLWRRDEDFPP